MKSELLVSHRFFIPPNWLTPSTVILHDETARQIRVVLRMKPDDELTVLDNSGTAYQIRLTQVAKNKVAGEIMSQHLVQSEPNVHLTLYQGTLKAQKFEWVLQKGTELGISQFVPTLCHRSIRNERETIQKKTPRWQRIIQEAAEQSGRGKLPKLLPPLPFAEALNHILAPTLILMPWEAAKATLSLKTILQNNQTQSIAIFIGPEGGFTPQEAELAQQTGAHLVKLGPRILRAETAGLAVCSAVLYALGEWD